MSQPLSVAAIVVVTTVVALLSFARAPKKRRLSSSSSSSSTQPGEQALVVLVPTASPSPHKREESAVSRPPITPPEPLPPPVTYDLPKAEAVLVIDSESEGDRPTPFVPVDAFARQRVKHAAPVAPQLAEPTPLEGAVGRAKGVIAPLPTVLAPSVLPEMMVTRMTPTTAVLGVRPALTVSSPPLTRTASLLPPVLGEGYVPSPPPLPADLVAERVTSMETPMAKRGGNVHFRVPTPVPSSRISVPPPPSSGGDRPTFVSDELRDPAKVQRMFRESEDLGISPLGTPQVRSPSEMPRADWLEERVRQLEVEVCELSMVSANAQQQAESSARICGELREAREQLKRENAALQTRVRALQKHLFTTQADLEVAHEEALKSDRARAAAEEKLGSLWRRIREHVREHAKKYQDEVDKRVAASRAAEDYKAKWLEERRARLASLPPHGRERAITAMVDAVLVPSSAPPPHYSGIRLSSVSAEEELSPDDLIEIG